MYYVLIDDNANAVSPLLASRLPRVVAQVYPQSAIRMQHQNVAPSTMRISMIFVTS